MKRPIDEKNTAEELIGKVVSGEATEEEAKVLKEEILKNKEIKEQYIQMAQAWSVGALYPHTLKYNAFTAWEKVLPEVRKRQFKDTSNKLFINTFVRNAAIWLVLFCLGGLTSFFVVRHSSPLSIAKGFSAPIETVSPLGSRSFLQLPDKSKVWLNAGSKLIYHQDYGLGTREVELIGEGFFDVATNPDKPFIVHAGDLNVKAFGTSFNVKAYPDEEVIEATLVEGKVTVEGKAVTIKQEGFVKKLVPGQKLTYIHGTEPANENITASKNTKRTDGTNRTTVQPSIKVETNVQTKKYTSWKDNEWIIEGEYLDDLMILLGRRFNVDMALSDASLKNYKFSGTIHRETLEQVMEILKYSAPIKYKIEKSNVTIQLDPGREKNYQHILDRTNK